MQYSDLSSEERARLRAAYEAGFTTGACAPWLLGDDPELIALVDAVADDWLLSLETRPAPARADAPIRNDELPGWLLRLPHQDAQPLEGWGTEGWPE